MSDFNKFYGLAIIGGGQSAKALLLILARQVMRRAPRRVPVRICVFERGHEFGAGFAWSPDVMLDEHYASQPTSYSRPRFGREQIREFSKLVALLAQTGIQVDLFPRTEIVDMHRHVDGWILSGVSEHWTCRAVVLATGHWPTRPADLAQVPYLDPWPSRRLQEGILAALGSGPRIGIVGSYLTAIDAAITIALAAGSFERHGYNELSYRPERRLHVTLVSRRGRLPWIWPEQFVARPLRWLTNSRIESVMQTGGSDRCDMSILASLLREELGEGGCDSLESAARLSHRYGALCRGNAWTRMEQIWCQAPPDWLPKVVGSLPVISEWFARLDASDHLLFRRSYQTAFFNLAMPMARGTALHLRAMRKAGCVDLLAVNKADWRIAGGNISCSWRDAAGSQRSMTFDSLVNGRAGGGDIRVHPSSLIRRLMARGLVQPGLRLGRPLQENERLEVEGIHVDTETCEVVPRGRYRAASEASTNLYAMGPNVSGLFLDAQSIGQVMRDAERIVNHLSSG